jgi:hypothetical protein
MWLYGCHSCRRTPLALQGKEAPKEGGPQKENKEVHDHGCYPIKHPPLALWGEEAPKKGGLLRGNEDNRRSEKNLLTRLQIRGIASQLHNRAQRTLQCKKTPDCIKPVESGYVVAAHVDDVYSLFRGRMPRRREDRSKRARMPQQRHLVLRVVEFFPAPPLFPSDSLAGGSGKGRGDRPPVYSSSRVYFLQFPYVENGFVVLKGSWSSELLSSPRWLAGGALPFHGAVEARAEGGG